MSHTHTIIYLYIYTYYHISGQSQCRTHTHTDTHTHTVDTLPWPNEAEILALAATVGLEDTIVKTLGLVTMVVSIQSHGHP